VCDLVGVVLVGDVGDVDLNCYNVYINPGSYLGDVDAVLMMC
jgi:hypothetical protein